MIACPKCRHQNPDDARRCSACGASLTAGAAATGASTGTPSSMDADVPIMVRIQRLPTKIIIVLVAVAVFGFIYTVQRPPKGDAPRQQTYEQQGRGEEYQKDMAIWLFKPAMQSSIFWPLLAAELAVIGYGSFLLFTRWKNSNPASADRLKAAVQNIGKSKEDPMERIAKAKSLLDAKAITQEEFDKIKAEAMQRV